MVGNHILASFVAVVDNHQPSFAEAAGSWASSVAVVDNPYRQLEQMLKVPCWFALVVEGNQPSSVAEDNLASLEASSASFAVALASSASFAAGAGEQTLGYKLVVGKHTLASFAVQPSSASFVAEVEPPYVYDSTHPN